MCLKHQGWLMRVWRTPVLALKMHKTFGFTHLFFLYHKTEFGNDVYLLPPPCPSHLLMVPRLHLNYPEKRNRLCSWLESTWPRGCGCSGSAHSSCQPRLPLRCGTPHALNPTLCNLLFLESWRPEAALPGLECVVSGTPSRFKLALWAGELSLFMQLSHSAAALLGEMKNNVAFSWEKSSASNPDANTQWRLSCAGQSCISVCEHTGTVSWGHR